MSVVWRPVVGWEGLYEVSSDGEIRSLPRIIRRKSRTGNLWEEEYAGKVLIPSNTRPPGRYHHVVLSADGRRCTKTVHSIVCEAFHGPRPPGHDVAHYDGDGKNNRADNLRWATKVENFDDMLRHGRRNKGERHGLSRLTDAQAREILESDEKATVIAARMNVNAQAVRRIRRGETWAHLKAKP